ncbi:hypothetical protein LCM10_05110 [Rossellomorea aquimaris]|uniref:hypothetical protein n=1 Tax=Rossellomorea aquimaris TaxID=189382 RepID=UPI001CD2B969|nr:hypothetical protein [Rossellomorea aquimaris]MCA1054357.1 hypothetical protein [Rossellomorea aquimaris]
MMIIIGLGAISLLVLFFMRGTPIEYEVMAKEDAPLSVQRALVEKGEVLGFQTFHEGDFTYIYYRSEDAHQEYTTTDISLKKQLGKIVATATVDHAYNDGEVSYEMLLKTERLAEEDLVLKEEFLVP